MKRASAVVVNFLDISISKEGDIDIVLIYSKVKLFHFYTLIMQIHC